MEIRKAKLEDMEQVRDLIGFYASKNLMLPRSLSYLYECLRDFTVAVEKKLIVGCCSLHLTWKDLAEIKSLAVDPRFVKKGIGGKLLEASLKEAKQLGLKKVFTLTLEPEFFEKNGFKKVDKESLPMKIWGECSRCTKYPDCDEVPLIKEMK
jgi:amino-acid N-acetyltransferase